MPERNRRLAVIGVGSMGRALARGIISAGVYPADCVSVADADKNRLAQVADELKATATGSVEAAANSSVIILAVRPPVIPEVLDEISTYVSGDQLVISIAAGVTIKHIEARLRNDVPVIRSMPNTPCLLREGATAICRGKNAGSEHAEKAVAIFGAVGKVIETPEKLMGAVTGLSGSGPAFVYTVIEALADGGVRAGLTRKQAALLAAQTVLGSAKMALETEKHPAELRDAVASPGGTAIAGICALESGGLRAALIDAVKAAADRTHEMAKESPEPEG